MRNIPVRALSGVKSNFQLRKIFGAALKNPHRHPVFFCGKEHKNVPGIDIAGVFSSLLEIFLNQMNHLGQFVLLMFRFKALIKNNYLLDQSDSFVIRYIYEQAVRISLSCPAKFTDTDRSQPVFLFQLSSCTGRTQLSAADVS
jgi:hypothetical protein